MHIEHKDTKKKRNDICTINLVQLLYNYLSYTHIMFLFSFFIFFSQLFLTNEKKEQQSCLKGCTKMVVKISLLFLIMTLNVITFSIVNFLLFFILTPPLDSFVHRRLITLTINLNSIFSHNY